mgnify:CR=1 FL=1
MNSFCVVIRSDDDIQVKCATDVNDEKKTGSGSSTEINSKQHTNVSGPPLKSDMREGKY